MFILAGEQRQTGQLIPDGIFIQRTIAIKPRGFNNTEHLRRNDGVSNLQLLESIPDGPARESGLGDGPPPRCDHFVRDAERLNPDVE